jgi:hypothetical protein
MLELVASGEGIEGDVQDVVGLMIRQVAFEEVEAAVDVGDQSGPACHQEHGTDPAAGDSVNAIAKLIADVAGGDHGLFPFRTGPILDSLERRFPRLGKKSTI